MKNKNLMRSVTTVIVVMLALSMVVVAGAAVKAGSIKLNKSSIRIAAKYQLKATVKPTGASKKVTWKSSNPAVASVSTTGLVKAKSVGTAKITATSKSNTKVEKVCVVTVSPVPTNKAKHVRLNDPRGTTAACQKCH